MFAVVSVAIPYMDSHCRPVASSLGCFLSVLSYVMFLLQPHEITHQNNMLFDRLPPDIDINVSLNNKEINRVSVTKCLRIFVYDQLNWKPHITAVTTKLLKVTAIIHKPSCLINQNGMYIL